MIRTYTIKELEELTGINKRTISDYIAKGLLSGPSHRGRGAVYSQRDYYVLRIVLKLRTLLKEEFGSLKAVARFLAKLSLPDMQLLAARKSEQVFTVEVHRLRLRTSLMALMPHVSPEKIDQVLDPLTPAQISAAASGHLQIGAVIDLRALFAREEQLSGDGEPASLSGAAVLEDTGQFPGLREAMLDAQDMAATYPDLRQALLDAQDMEATHPDRSDVGDNSRSSNTDGFFSKKLDEIDDRLGRVEQKLE
jgi:DNA-binding transcriptional MerR regulator